MAPATPGSSPAGVKPAPDSKIEVTADAVDADVAQNAGKATLRGNVEVRQGERASIPTRRSSIGATARWQPTATSTTAIHWCT